jgi:mRNA interferase HigB
MVMKVTGRNKLVLFYQKHTRAKKALEAWVSEVESADWQTTHDVKRRYPSADFIQDNQVIFNIKGNTYRLAVKIHYQNGIVLVKWVGAHAEYSKKRF